MSDSGSAAIDVVPGGTIGAAVTNRATRINRRYQWFGALLVMLALLVITVLFALVQRYEDQRLQGIIAREQAKMSGVLSVIERTRDYTFRGLKNLTYTLSEITELTQTPLPQTLSLETERKVAAAFESLLRVAPDYTRLTLVSPGGKELFVFVADADAPLQLSTSALGSRASTPTMVEDIALAVNEIHVRPPSFSTPKTASNERMVSRRMLFWLLGEGNARGPMLEAIHEQNALFDIVNAIARDGLRSDYWLATAEGDVILGGPLLEQLKRQMGLGNRSLSLSRLYSDEWASVAGRANGHFLTEHGLFIFGQLLGRPENIVRDDLPKPPVSLIFVPLAVLQADSFVRSPAGLLTLVIGVITLISLGILIFRQLKSAAFSQLQRETLESYVTRQRQIFGLISGDLRNPAANIHMLARELPDKTSGKAELEEASQYLLTRIDDLGLAVNPDSDIVIERQKVALNTMIAEALRESEPLLVRAKLRMSVDTSATDGVEFAVDATRIKSVIGILLKNAATHSGGECVVIKTSLGQFHGQQTMLISIADDGVGIHSTLAEQIFMPYERGDTVVAGKGVGLHLARTWLDLMGATLEYRQREGGGACFDITLPLGLSETDTQMDNTIQRGVRRLREQLINTRVLLVDDDQIFLAATTRLLQRELTIDLVVAENHEEALNIAGNRIPPDIILLSDRLKSGGGAPRFARELAIQGYEGKLIVLRGVADSVAESELSMLGVDGFMEKPLTVAKLMDALS